MSEDAAVTTRFGLIAASREHADALEAHTGVSSDASRTNDEKERGIELWSAMMRLGILKRVDEGKDPVSEIQPWKFGHFEPSSKISSPGTATLWKPL